MCIHCFHWERHEGGKCRRQPLGCKEAMECEGPAQLYTLSVALAGAGSSGTDMHSLPPAATFGIPPPNLFVGLGCYLRSGKAVLVHIKFNRNRWDYRLQRVADTSLHAGTYCTSFAAVDAIIWPSCPAVRLPFRTARADPVHLLVASQSDQMWKEPLRLIALMVPFSQPAG